MNRFEPHNVTFGLNPTQQPEAFLSAISMSSPEAQANNSLSSVELIKPEAGIYVIIDSSTPFLWLPKSVCERFAEELGLSYNETLQLYTFDRNNSIHDDLRSRNLEFTFSLSDTSTPSQMVNVTLPYAAFDLQLTYPYIPNTTYDDPEATKNYFPLRQATSDDQYTLGRSFLQEAYIITDYERNNFSIHQAIHIPDPIRNTSIVSITRPSSSKLEGPLQTASIIAPHPGLTRLSIVGIAIGGALAFVGLLLVVFLCCCRRRQKPRIEFEESKRCNDDILHSYQSYLHEAGGVPVIIASEMDSSSLPRFELPDSQVPAELDSEASTPIGTGDSIGLTAYECVIMNNEVLVDEGGRIQRDFSVNGHYRQYEAANPSPLSSESSTASADNDLSMPSPPCYSLHSNSHIRYACQRPYSVDLPQTAGAVGDMVSAEGDTMDTLGSGYTEAECTGFVVDERFGLWDAKRSGRWEEAKGEMEFVHVPVVAETRFSWEGPGNGNGTVIDESGTKYF
jgi:hypothetical protein